MRQQLRITNDDRPANRAHFFFRHRLKHNLRPYPSRITHGNTNARASGPGSCGCAVAPEPDEFVVIREYSEQNGISTATLEAVAMNSQEYLPIAHLPLLDVVLIDGDHAFPSPFIDWYYTADRLAVGGLMIVDDIQLITGRLLADFMDADPKWDRVLYEPSRFGVYRKVRHPIHEGRWFEQPYVADSNPVRQVTVVRAVADLPEASSPVHPVLLSIYAHLPSTVQALYRSLRRLYRLTRS